MKLWGVGREHLTFKQRISYYNTLKKGKKKSKGVEPSDVKIHVPYNHSTVGSVSSVETQYLIQRPSKHGYLISKSRTDENSTA